MGEELSDTMNLDLNLGPNPESDLQQTPNETVNLADWSNSERFRSLEPVTRIRTRHRTRFRQLNLPIHTMAIELNQLIGNETPIQTGEASERVNEEVDVEEEKKSDIEGNFFDCNICLDISKEPVLTCCGHLYCWPCLYQWLQISDSEECPVCKGEVTPKNVTPIYGRGNQKKETEESLDTKIPMRPHAKRIESLRNTIQRGPFTIPMEEMIRRLQSRFENDSNTPPEGSDRDRASLVLNRLMTSRGVRSEASEAVPTEDTDPNEGETVTTRFQPLLIRRQLQSHRVARISNLTSALSSAERLVDSYFRYLPLPVGRSQSQEGNPSNGVVDDRDSFSSIAAVINSESQVDTAVEIDSMVTLSTSSSRRRNENGSDVNSADSRPRPPRRRRFN